MLVSGGRHFGFKTIPPTEQDEDAYLAEVLTDRGIKFIEDNKERPFALFLNHYAVHIPLEARRELIAKYESKEKPAEGVNNPIYAAMVEHVDNSVGAILDALDASGVADNTVVVFFSDNGGLVKRYDDAGPIVSSNAPLRGEKGTLYEGGVRVPLIVRWPGTVAPGSTCSIPVCSVDFFPTFLEIAGDKVNPEWAIDGVSITPLLRQSGKPWRDALYWHYPHYHHSSPAGAVRAGDWKLIEFYEDRRVELYDVRNDIGETKDLAAEMPLKAKGMRALLEGWRRTIGAEMPTANPDFDPERRLEWGTHPARG